MGSQCSAELKIGRAINNKKERCVSGTKLAEADCAGIVQEDIMQEKITAIVLAAGQGKRMQSSIQKQYMLLEGKPLIYYSLKAFEESAADEIILVAAKGETEYCQKEIVEPYGFKKVTQIVEGGKERYHSVYEGLKAAAKSSLVLIHDGARPLLTVDIIERAVDGARKYRACVVGMPVKDTIKIADEEEYAVQTPERHLVWQIQTPQAFEYSLIKKAYDLLMSDEANQIGITDDAMVTEKMLHQSVKLILGSYSNIKVTTPEDMEIAETLMNYILR